MQNIEKKTTRSKAKSYREALVAVVAMERTEPEIILEYF
jgi:hypothetical protein